MTYWLKYIMIVVLCGLSLHVYAQSSSTGTESAMRTSITLNAGISDCKRPALGFTIARSDKWGYYASFMMGVDNLHSGYDYHIDTDGCLVDGEYAGLIPFYSGRRAYNRYSATIGGLCRMGIPLYAYAGAGYGFRTETRELLNNQWVQAASSLGNSAVVEVGLTGQLGKFILQAGYTLFVGQQMRLYHEAKVGIGFIMDK